MVHKAKTKDIIAYLDPHDQEIVKFMVQKTGEYIEKMYLAEMCALIIEYDDSEEYQMEFKIWKGNA